MRTASFKTFQKGERVKLTDEMLEVPVNYERWAGKRGTVLGALGENEYLVKWDHLEKPMMQCGAYIELATN